MNIDETKEAIKVMQSFVDGKSISKINPHWDWNNNIKSYEVKPELFESWLWFLRAFPVNGDNSVSFKSKAHALQYLDRQGEGVIIHMREVE